MGARSSWALAAARATTTALVVVGCTTTGDVLDGDAIVRDNTVCQSGGATGNAVNVIAPNSTDSNNVTVTGPAAVVGICAP